MPSRIACEAMRLGRCLRVQYDGTARVVEVHAVGIDAAGLFVMRVYQTRGGREESEPPGWKLLSLDETAGVRILDEASNAPRPGYKRGDQDLRVIIREL